MTTSRDITLRSIQWTRAATAALAVMLALSVVAQACSRDGGNDAAEGPAAPFFEEQDDTAWEWEWTREGDDSGTGQNDSDSPASGEWPADYSDDSGPDQSYDNGSASEQWLDEGPASGNPDSGPDLEPMSGDSGLAPAEAPMASSAGESATQSAQSAQPAATSPVPPPPDGQRRRPCRNCDPDTFQDYGVNPFVDTWSDPLSTFALDVDTASYAVTRNFLQGGQLPPIEAVRVEEFVNYFDGGYESVTDEFMISLEAAPTPFTDSRDLLLRVGVQAPRRVSHAAQPDTVVLVMDRSGSMDEPTGNRNQPMSRMTLAHRAVELLISGLPRHTRVGVVAYESGSSTVLEPTVIEGNAKSIMDRIRSEVVPGGSTNVESGLVRGFDMALAEADARRQVLVLLLSDGVANVGATRTEEILRSIGERADIGLSTIGVGLGPFNDVLLEQLANRADGTYHYIDTPSEAVRIFVDDRDGLLTHVARDAKVQVEFNPELVRSYRLLGFENRDVADEAFRDDSVDAGELGVGHSSTALYELEFNDEAVRARDTLATVKMRYQRPATGTVVELITVLTASGTERRYADTSPHFRLAAVAAELAEVLRGSPYTTRRSLPEVIDQADELEGLLPRDPDVAELAELARTAQDLLERPARR